VFFWVDLAILGMFALDVTHFCPTLSTYFPGVLQTIDGQGNRNYTKKKGQTSNGLYPVADDDKDTFLKKLTYFVSSVPETIVIN
jgi:hypothetical protein